MPGCGCLHSHQLTAVFQRVRDVFDRHKRLRYHPPWVVFPSGFEEVNNVNQHPEV